MLKHLLLFYRNDVRINRFVGPKSALILCATLQDQPQAEQAAHTSRFNASASSECDDSPEASEGFHGGFWDSSTPVHRIPLRPTGGMQHGSLEGSKYANSKALLHAVRLGRSQDVERLLNAGCNVDVQDADGFTPIYHAARGNLPATLNEPAARACLEGASCLCFNIK